MERVAQQIPDPRVEDLVRAGRVRVALLEGVAPGIRMDLTRAFAARLGIEVLPIEYPTPAAAVESLNTGACDVGFLVIDPARAAVVDFSPPILGRAFTYLVPSGSKIRCVADADQPGVRIAVVRSHVSELALSRIVKHAELLRARISGYRFRTAESRERGGIRVAPRRSRQVFASDARLKGAGGPLRNRLLSDGGPEGPR